MPVPDIRVACANARDVRADGDYVLYWMIASRRTRWNFSLDRAIEIASRLGKPLVVFEALRAGYPWASDRLHAFVLQGMGDNARALAGSGIVYYPYVEPAPGAGRGLLEALAGHAAIVVTDDYPAFFLRRMVDAAAGRLPVRLEAVDSNGLLPLRATERAFPTAHAFRRHLQRHLRAHLDHFPCGGPVRDRAVPPGSESVLPPVVPQRWPAASREWFEPTAGLLARLPIDHAVAPVATARGGSRAAELRLRAFLATKLSRYADRHQPQEDVTSGLSPYLHFGHVSAHQVFHDVMTAEGWTSRRLAASATGSREGWWGTPAPAESFLDQLVTWRELGHNMCHHRPADYDRYSSLPAWAVATLAEHAGDPRPHVYALRQLDAADTHDALWNAAQVQLRREGAVHNYMRMLWGKKILEWSASPEEALSTMIELNDRYALDGRDPNSYSGIFWVLGRYDRPWAPQRPVFGSVRYMSSANTARKLRVKDYVARYGPERVATSLFD